MAKQKMSNKKVLIIGLCVIAVCLIISIGYMAMHRSVSREPTRQETQTYAPYAVDWSAAAEEGMSEKEFILSQCAEIGEKEIGEHLYTTFTSETLGGSLYQCEQITEIILNEAGTLHISYTDTAGRMVIIGYTDEGMCELAIYDEPTDTLYHTIDGSTEVWTNFRNGFQWGS